MPLKLALAAAALLSSSLAARADRTYYLSGTLTDGDTFTGTLNWSPTGGILDLGTFTQLNVATSGGFSYNGPSGLTIPNSGETDTTAYYGLSPYSPDIYLKTDAKYETEDVLSSEFSGTYLCGTGTNCGGEMGPLGTPGIGNPGYLSFVDGISVVNGTLTLDPPQTGPTTTAVTPEPSSIALLGTGLLGVAGVVRKRLA